MDKEFRRERMLFPTPDWKLLWCWDIFFDVHKTDQNISFSESPSKCYVLHVKAYHDEVKHHLISGFVSSVELSFFDLVCYHFGFCFRSVWVDQFGMIYLSYLKLFNFISSVLWWCLWSQLSAPTWLTKRLKDRSTALGKSSCPALLNIIILS